MNNGAGDGINIEGRGLGPIRLSARFHLALTYLVIIWVTLGLLMAFLSQYLETTAVGARLSHLYAQAHLLVSAVEARGGPRWGVMGDVGGVPARGRVLLISSGGRVLDDSAADDEYRDRDLSVVAEVKAALTGQQSANTYYLEDGMFAAYVAVPAAWGTPTALPGSPAPTDVESAGTVPSGAAPSGTVFITQDLTDILAQHQSTMRVVLWGGVGASLLALVVAWTLSSVILGPVLELSGVARRMASGGRLDLRVTPKGPKETRDLADSFNYMASGIEKAMSAHEEFLLAAAHELRSPLAAMNAMVESMEIQQPRPDELPGFFRDVRGELTRIIHTTEEILDLLRLRNEGQVEKQMVDAVAMVRQLVADRQRVAEERSIRLEFRGDATAVGDAARNLAMAMNSQACRNYGDGTSPLISISPALLRLVVGNLLDNALKFTGPGGSVAADAQIVDAGSSDAPEDGSFVLKVSDTGTGIPASELPRIFERFYRVDRARRKSTGGAGLGLAIVKDACERSGGTVTVESEEGRGSTFTVVWRSVASNK